LAFLALCKVWLCVGVLCAMQCAKNSVGQRRQSHANLNVSRISYKIATNVLRLCAGGVLEFLSARTVAKFIIKSLL
jgi:hypothetical protein